jgi:hypothetical protein
MNKSLLLGMWRYLLRLPPAMWQAEVQKSAAGMDRRLAFMTAEHHQVRNFVVAELPRHGRPLAPETIAGQLGLPLDRVQTILAALERKLTFLYRNPQGEVTWAYPVTVEPTPHRLTFRSGEQAYAA